MDLDYGFINCSVDLLPIDLVENANEAILVAQNGY